MASPTVDLCSSESSLSEDAAPEPGHKPTTTRDRTSAVKREVSKSPPLDSRSKGSQGKKSGSGKTGATPLMEDGMEANGQHQSSIRKKRARATPSEEPETNGRKSATDSSGRESSLWPGGEGEGPVQGSLLEEVLAEKRMALMRSPQVMQFLQQRQMMIQAAQQRGVLNSHSSHSQTPAHLCVGEVEEDANS